MFSVFIYVMEGAYVMCQQDMHMRQRVIHSVYVLVECRVQRQHVM